MFAIDLWLLAKQIEEDPDKIYLVGKLASLPYFMKVPLSDFFSYFVIVAFFSQLFGESSLYL